MFDVQALSQLSKLKDDIVSSKEYATGKVVGTQSRFGFVRLDDGRDAFLSPEKMQRVLPGDSVKIIVVAKDESKWEAELESLIESPLKQFVGVYHIKSNGHFIEPKYALAKDTPDNKKITPVAESVKRWIFVPPKQRAGCDEGDYTLAEMQRHPFKDGRAQAKILRVIGPPSQEKFELKLTQVKYGIDRDVGAKVETQSNSILACLTKASFADREDLTHLPFVTIDGVTTRDMDDAIALVNENDTQVLYVGIADPSSFIERQSPIADDIIARSQTAYLSGGTVSMLPQALANDGFSLLPNKKQPALTCRLQFDTKGAISDYSFISSVIQSEYKLSYEDVANALSEPADECTKTNLEVPPSIITMLKDLYTLSGIRAAYREEFAMIGQQQQEYSHELDAAGHIVAIYPRPRLPSHQLVEECMVAVNTAAGEFLAKNNRGIFSTHEGFRKDRIGEVRALLKEENIRDENLETREGYIGLLKQLKNSEEQSKLIPALHRFSSYSTLSLQASAHCGMGIERYAPITSPIRRFADLYNHWNIYSALNKTETLALDEQQVLAINERIRLLRQADRELKQWLSCLYLRDSIGKEFSARIRIVTQQGIGARINDNGIDGFILFPKKQEKTFDAKRMNLETAGKKYSIQDEITIRVKDIELDKKRISFELANP